MAEIRLMCLLSVLRLFDDCHCIGELLCFERLFNLYKEVDREVL